MANQNRLQEAWRATFGQAFEETRPVRPFFFMLTAALLFIYFWSVADSLRLRSSPVLLAVFTALMILYLALFWLSPKWAMRQPQAVIYLIVQAALAFTLTMLAQNAAMVFGLFAALVGVTVGMLGRTRSMIAAVMLEVGLSALAFVLIAGSVSLGAWALSIGPIIVFVIIYVVMYVRELEAREEAQHALRELDAAHRQLTAYAAQVEDLTLTNERQRMARELHDTLSQGLAGLVLQLEAIDSHLSRGNTPKAQAITQQAMDRARSTLADARRAIDDLRSGTALDIDLETAVREETDRFTAASGIPCALSIDLPPSLPDDVRDNALRVVSEALTNIARYAQAQQVTISLRPIDHSLDIEIRDDGMGFDPAQVGAGHYGLIGLRERTRLIGGTLNVESEPGQGTTLKVILPLANTGHRVTEAQRA
jgi:two-component system, NarL family, sensor histidine kinase YdfH